MSEDRSTMFILVKIYFDIQYQSKDLKPVQYVHYKTVMTALIKEL